MTYTHADPTAEQDYPTVQEEWLELIVYQTRTVQWRSLQWPGSVVRTASLRCGSFRR